MEDAQEDITKGGIIGFFTAGAKLLGVKIPGVLRNKIIENNLMSPLTTTVLANKLTK